MERETIRGARAVLHRQGREQRRPCLLTQGWVSGSSTVFETVILQPFCLPLQERCSEQRKIAKYHTGNQRKCARVGMPIACKAEANAPGTHLGLSPITPDLSLFPSKATPFPHESGPIPPHPADAASEVAPPQSTPGLHMAD